MKFLPPIAALALLAYAAPAIAAGCCPSTAFAHPQEGDAIPLGESVHVVASTRFADPPADARLESSEDGGLTWDVVPFEVHGRTIQGTYEPGVQSNVVRFRTLSATDPWFISQISAFTG